MLRFSFGNINGKAHGLNANEMCVYEAIAKCSRKDDARGWYASMQTLADALPFRINRMTVARCVDKLLNLELIRRDGNSLYANAQNVQPNAQIEQPIAQNVQQIAQIEQISTPPNNPLLNNNKDMKENTLTHVPTHDAELQTPSFEQFLKAFGKGYTETTKNSAEMKWNLCSKPKKLALMAELKAGTWDKPRPDWCIGDFPEPEPQFLRGDEPQDIVRVLYQGMHKLCSRATQQLFGLTYEGEWNK